MTLDDGLLLQAELTDTHPRRALPAPVFVDPKGRASQDPDRLLALAELEAEGELDFLLELESLEGEADRTSCAAGTVGTSFATAAGAPAPGSAPRSAGETAGTGLPREDTGDGRTGAEGIPPELAVASRPDTAAGPAAPSPGGPSVRVPGPGAEPRLWWACLFRYLMGTLQLLQVEPWDSDNPPRLWFDAPGDWDLELVAVHCQKDEAEAAARARLAEFAEALR